MEYLEIEEEYGAVYGYIVNFKSESFKNYIKEEISDLKKSDKIINFIENKEFENILVIKNLNVYDGYKGNGYGRGLLEDALSRCDIAILISDSHEIQEKGFNLDKFYESSDFQKITDGGGGSFMCYPSATFLELKKTIDVKPQKRSFKM